ncbi:DNA replication protein [Paenibacillus illinoisensis]|uniref:DNA replication protein n=1 Tax=Paenibacillus illinoisensis TaxID=59845 RepID=UPI00203CE3A8|nr:DNA replication protein [Paenibacillus illinoisensis]MCM3205673.1 DNA replication protein [Paenibacillus illinoisensis]
MSNAPNCILAQHCSLADGPKCTRLCGSYIAMHGFNGAGGRVGAANLPDEYRMVTIANSPARASQAAVYAKLDPYVATFARQFEEGPTERIKSLYLVSASPGTGKTTTAAAVTNEYITRHFIGSIQRNRQALDRPAYFLDVNAWQTLYNEFNRARVPDDVAEPAARQFYAQMQAAKTAPFVVLDDIGVREVTEGFRGDLHAIINHRATNGLITIYTSNVAIDELPQVFKEIEPRLVDRIRDMCIVLPFVGESKRGLRRSA